MKVVISTSLLYLVFFHLSPAQDRTIVLNEFMYDPTPVVGLPDAEYVEILNSTKDVVHLSGWTLNDRLIPETSLMPGAILLLCESSKIDLFGSSIHTLGLSSWDRLNNDGQSIVLKDHTGNIIDSLTYDARWISDPMKDEGGWSLELINPLKICTDKNNWTVSVNLNGGTPGFNNSVYDITPDRTSPRVVHIDWLAADTLQLIFSEIVNFSTPNPSDIFSISPGFMPFDITFNNYTNTQVLILRQALDSGMVYDLRIQNLTDCENNLITDTLIQIGIGKEPKFNNVLITELMVDENPSVGLPESEYIEILNNTVVLLSLTNTYLFDESNTYVLPNIQILPSTYYVLVPSTKADLYRDFKNIIPMDKFPRLNNDGKILGLYNRPTGLLFVLHYEKTWYKYFDRSEGGYSLEMIDIGNPCGESNNWSASKSIIGGTPGQINSYAIDNPDLTGPMISKAYATEDNRISVLFNEKLHPACFNLLSLYLNEHDMKNLWTYDTIMLNSIEMNLPFLPDDTSLYNLTISGARDCVDNPMIKEGVPFPIHVPAIPDRGEMIINEILFNPKPGGVDWIEIYNVSEKYIDIQNWYVSNKNILDTINSYALSENHHIVEPYSFLVLTKDVEKLCADFPYARTENILEVRNLPGMPDNQGFISLWTSEMKKMDELSYNEDQHNLFIKDAEGVSLERVSPLQPTDELDNWQSASSFSGYGTPTYRNSQYMESGKMDFKISITPLIISPDQDGYDDYLMISITHQKPGFVANMYIFNIKGGEIKALVKGLLMGTNEEILWDGLLENGQIASPGPYILLLEMFHPDGDSYTRKYRFVVARKF